MNYRYHTDDRCPLPRLTWVDRLIIAVVVVVALATLGAAVMVGSNSAHAAVTTVTSIKYAYKPCSTCKEVLKPTASECEQAAKDDAAKNGETRTTGSAVYTCVTRYNVIATFKANPVPPVTCPAPPPPRTQPCPAGTSGSWEQTALVGPAPTCSLTWNPQSPATGACPALPPSGTATLTWTPPTKNVDGTPFTTLRNYRILYGTNASALSQTLETLAGAEPKYEFKNLAPGTYYFAVRAVNSAGMESVNSNVVTKVVR